MARDIPAQVRGRARSPSAPHGEGARPHAPQAGRAVAPRPPPLEEVGGRGASTLSDSAPTIKRVVCFEDFFADDTRNGFKIPQSEYATGGSHIIIDQGDNEIAGYSDREDGLYTSVPVVVFGDHTRIVKYVNRPFFLGADGVKILKPKEGILPLYSFYALKAARIESLGYSRHFKLVKEIRFPLPPLSEQKRIAAILDKICEMKRNAEARLQKLDLLVKARFVEMFGEGKSPAQRLGDIAEITGGLTKNGKRKSLPLKYKYLRVANVFFNRLDLSDVQEIGVEEAEVCKALLKMDDLLFVEGNGSIEQVGRVALWSGEIDPCLHQNHLIKARFSAGIIPQYALFFFMNEVGRQQIKECAVSTTGLHTLSTGKVANLRLPLPPLTLQRQFAAFVEKVEGLKATAKKELEQVDLLYRAKLQEFFG